ncbi:MAG: PQQ-binding-like beta-propeller repeat protein, partial [Chitinophagaceae bacterium]
ALCGHGHNNRPVQAEDIPAVMGRSNLRAKAEEGGYNLVDVRMDSILFTERKSVSKNEKLWTKVAVQQHNYDLTKKYARPDFSINQKYPQVKSKWIFQSNANVISTPAVINNLVIFGNQNGVVQALALHTGKKVWSYKTAGPIFSSPAASTDKIVFGSADAYVHCLDTKGKKVWQLQTDGPVLGSPTMDSNVVYIGGSDHCFQAVELKTGKPIWRSCILNGPVVSKPVIYNNSIIFGAWDKNLYSLDKKTGKLLWKWNNGSSVINYSPASVIPVVHDDVVYVVAPDRYLSAIDANTGKTLWRTNEATVRESIGISGDGRFIYAKTMQDTVVAFNTTKEKTNAAWKVNAGYGYDHVPSMLIEKDSQIFFGTRSGVVYSVDATTQKINWAYKIDNSMVNTVNVINSSSVIASTMDGKVTLLKIEYRTPPAKINGSK